MPRQPKLTLPKNRSRSTKGHDLYKPFSTTDLDATCQVSRQLAQRFWRRSFFLRFWALFAWRPSWSCDLDNVYKLLFPVPNETPHKTWLWLSKWFWRRRYLKSLSTTTTTTTTTTDAGASVYYNSPCEPDGSGELKKCVWLTFLIIFEKQKIQNNPIG